MDQRRIFLAVDISKQVRTVCDQHIDYLRASFPGVRVGWETSEKMHITLKFLGNTSSKILRTLEARVAEIAESHNSFRLKLSRTGLFPRETRPRVLWIGLDDRVQALAPLSSELDTLFEQFDYPRETRTFRPHITIGRVRDPDKASELAGVHLKTKIEPVEFGVNEIVMYESKLESTGSVYSVISTANLRPSI